MKCHPDSGPSGLQSQLGKGEHGQSFANTASVGGLALQNGALRPRARSPLQPGRSGQRRPPDHSFKPEVAAGLPLAVLTLTRVSPHPRPLSPRQQLVVIVAAPTQVDLQLGSLPGHFIQHPAVFGQPGLVDRLQAGDLVPGHLLSLGDPLPQDAVLLLQALHPVDVDDQAVVQPLQHLLLLPPGDDRRAPAPAGLGVRILWPRRRGGGHRGAARETSTSDRDSEAGREHRGRRRGGSDIRAKATPATGTASRGRSTSTAAAPPIRPLLAQPRPRPSANRDLGPAGRRPPLPPEERFKTHRGPQLPAREGGALRLRRARPSPPPLAPAHGTGAPGNPSAPAPQPSLCSLGPLSAASRPGPCAPRLPARCPGSGCSTWGRCAHLARRLLPMEKERTVLLRQTFPIPNLLITRP